MSNQYENLTKKFSFHTAGTEVTGVNNVVLALKKLMETEGSTVSITETRKDKAVKFDIYQGKKAGAIRDLSEVTPQVAISFMQFATGKKLIRQSNEGVRHALSEANVRAAYEKVLEGVKLTMAPGSTMEDAHREFLKFLQDQAGESKEFSAEALTILAQKLTGKAKKSDVTTKDRVDLLLTLQAAVVSPAIRKMITDEGYDAADFLKVAKEHHFVFYPNRVDKDGNGTYRLAAGSSAKYMSEKRNKKAIDDGIIEHDRNAPHIIIDKSVPEKKIASNVVVAVRAAGVRNEDLDLKAATEFLKSKGTPEGVIKSLAHKNIKDLAESQGWKATPVA